MRSLPLLLCALAAATLTNCGRTTELTALHRADSGRLTTLCLPSPADDGETTFSEIAIRNASGDDMELTTVDTGIPALTVTDLYTFAMSGNLPGSGMAWRPPADATRIIPAGTTRGLNLRLHMSGTKTVEGEGVTVHYRSINSHESGAVAAGTNFKILPVGQRNTC